MCGRFALYSSLKEIEREFEIKSSIDIKPSYNIAPSQEVLAVVDGSFEKLRWGLIPFWAKERSMAMINAKAETVDVKPFFKKPFEKQRCLIVADGFFEWKKSNNEKIPKYIRLKNKRPFSFAGLYDDWKSPEGKMIRSCAIITCEPNDLLKKIHNRMPVIIPREKRKVWIEKPEQDLLKPFPAEEMESYPVSPIVNSPKNISPECIAPK